MKKNKKIMVAGGILLANFVLIAVFLLYKPSAFSAAANFTLTDVHGKTFSLSDYHGRVTILSFIKTRCSSCRIETTQLKAIYEKYHDDVTILSISIDPAYDTDQQLLQFKNETGITWTVARGTDEIKSDYDIQTSPTTIIVDRSGYIQFKHTGEVAQEELSQQLERIR